MSTEGRALRLVVYGLLLVMTAALVSWFLTSFERRTEEVHVGYSAEARRNKLLAAERFLRRARFPVESVSGRERLWQPPESTDVLVVLGLGGLSPERSERLLRWVEQGGRLVVEATEVWTPADSPDDLLSDLGFALHFDSEDSGDESDAEPLATIESVAASRPLRVSFLADYWLSGRDGDEVLAAVDGRPRVLRRRVGQGTITVLSDTELMTNQEIGDHDHAFFLGQLTRPAAGGRVWLLYDGDVPWLGALLWSIAPYLLISAGILILVWLWSVGRRLGPRLDAPDRRRRDLIEHLDASGAFLWRHGEARTLLETSRQRILGDWLRRHPGLAHADSQTQARALAEMTGEPSERTHRLIFTQPEDAAALVEQAARLQQVRQLARGRRRAAPSTRRHAQLHWGGADA